jgi:DNA polymerase-3 subunit alpha
MPFKILIKESIEIPLEIANVPLDDKAYLVFADANTTAVFQFESVGMKKMLKEARPSKFEEIIAFVSLYRPGPMDLIPDFIHRMHGGEFEYLHPLLEGVLEPTYGIMVYQEQVMQAAQFCAGYTLGGADLLRRAMGKRNLKKWLNSAKSLLKVLQKKILMKQQPTISSTIWKSSQVMVLTNHMPQPMPLLPIILHG